MFLNDFTKLINPKQSNIIKNVAIIDMNTLTFVALHELSHIATESVGHKQEFWQNYILTNITQQFQGLHQADMSLK